MEAEPGAEEPSNMMEQYMRGPGQGRRSNSPSPSKPEEGERREGRKGESVTKIGKRNSLSGIFKHYQYKLDRLKSFQFPVLNKIQY